MGAVLNGNQREPRRMAISVEGWDCLDRVEVLENCRVAKRWSDFDLRPTTGARRFKVWTHWGYHPQGGKNWNFSVEAENGKIIGYNPCFTPPGHSRAQIEGSRRLVVNSQTAPPNNIGAIQKVCLEVEGHTETRLTILNEGKAVLTGTIGELLGDTRCALPFGPFSGAFSLGRAVAAPHFTAQLQWEGAAGEGSRDYYYVRVFQKNGQMAWSSPIWVMPQ